eukprot:c22521_g2_i3 orf=162-683(-)
MALGLDKAASIACIVERQGFKLGFIGSNYFRVKVCLGNNSRRFWRSAKCTMIQISYCDGKDHPEELPSKGKTCGTNLDSFQQISSCNYQTLKRWCALCGSSNGQMTCNYCMGEGGYATRPGLAGMRGKVGWARCKNCLGYKSVPCILCTFPDLENLNNWSDDVRCHPNPNRTP